MMLSHALLLLASNLAPDSDPELDFTWQAPAGCPEADAIVRRVREGRGASQSARLQLRADGRVDTAPNGVVVQLSLESTEGVTVRTFEAATCHEAADTAALVLIMTLSGLPKEPTPLPTPTPTSDPVEDAQPRTPTRVEVVPAQPPAAPPPAPRRARPREPLELRASANGGVGFGPVPGLTSVFELSVGIGRKSWVARVATEQWSPSTGSDPGRTSAVRARLLAAGGYACGLFHPAAGLDASVCGGVVAGSLWARGANVEVPRARRGLWVAARVRPGLTVWVMPWLGLGMRGSVDVALRAPRFRTEPSGRVFTPRPWGVMGLAGLSLRIPTRR